MTPHRFAIEHHTLCDGWTNAWTEDDEPVTFPSRDAAEAGLATFLAERLDECPDDYRIVRVASP